MLKYVAALMLPLVLFAKPANSQRLPFGRQHFPETTPVVVLSDDMSLASQRHLERVRIAQVIAERRAQLHRDTDKLVAITAGLKERVDTAELNKRAIDSIKKEMREIQKLAKSVQDKMRNPY